jgi:hypothetical protein
MTINRNIYVMPHLKCYYKAAIIKVFISIVVVSFCRHEQFSNMVIQYLVNSPVANTINLFTAVSYDLS